MNFEIGRALETQQPFALDIASVITGRTFMASITRWGKSWTARKTVEECFGHAGIIIIDPEGEYASLREKYPFLIIGKDIPIQIETAEFMADKILETKISVIIDLSLVEEELGKEYVNTFLRRFFFLETTARQPYLVVIEEAEDFGPEKGVATTTCLGIVVNLTKKGGKRGIGVLLIAHRPAWVSKGLISQCANKALGRIDWPGDLEVLEKYARVPHETIEKLPTLGKGEFCFTGDWVEETTFVKVGQVRTTHLGYTPEVVPPSPKELQGVIESLQKSLPEVIEKIKPTVVSTAEIESKIRNELDNKYKSKIEAILKTADEKAERKYRVRIDQLQEQLDKLSRSQALQPAAPITDVLEHPIVKTRMLELPDKARDLLVKIEREPSLTREQLAAFLTTSRDTVANLVEKINQVFHATAIIGDGKPIRYKSMLKRLFITDVADREIKELERLQAENREKGEKITSLEAKVRDLGALRLEHEQVKRELSESDEQLGRALAENQRLIQENKDLKLLSKAGEALDSAITMVTEKRLNTLKEEILNEVKKIGTYAPSIPEGPPPIDEKRLEELIDRKVKEMSTVTPPSGGSIPTSVELEHKVTHFDFTMPEEHVKADTTTVPGRIIYTVLKDPSFWDKRHSPPEVTTKLATYGWTHESKTEVSAALAELCQKGIFTRVISTGNYWWYTLTPDAKERIHLEERGKNNRS